MYVPEINFLKDRVDGPGPGFTDEQMDREVEAGGPDFLLIGIAVAVGAFVLVTGATLFYNGQVEAKTAELAQVNSNIQQIQGEVQQLQAQEKQLQEIQARSQAVINLFDLSRPWSAVMEDLRRRVPASLWIENFTAAGNVVQVTGKALDYTQVAAFQLTLESSPFVQSVLIKDASQQPATDLAPATVSYSIEVTLNQQGIGSYATVLEETGSVGLLEKLRRLQKENLIQ